MLIKIDDNNTFNNIQQRFRSLFPFLKLEFLKKKTPFPGSGVSIKQPITILDKTLAESRTIFKEGTITISPEMTISELEKCFNEIYGLSTQVLRQSGNVWLITTVTDKWTLEEQNRQGEIITQQVNERKLKRSE
jgi:hypothetical protein